MVSFTVLPTAILALLLASTQVNAQITQNCYYGSLKCGSSLTADGYADTDFVAGVSALPASVIPTLNAAERLKVLYRCSDNTGDLVAVSYCFAGCQAIDGVTSNDQCAY